jgi:hypothetical protein
MGEEGLASRVMLLKVGARRDDQPYRIRTRHSAPLGFACIEHGSQGKHGEGPRRPGGRRRESRHRRRVPEVDFAAQYAWLELSHPPVGPTSEPCVISKRERNIARGVFALVQNSAVRGYFVSSITPLTHASINSLSVIRLTLRNSSHFCLI